MKLLPDGWSVQPVNEVCAEVVDCINKTAPVVQHQTGYKMIRTTNVRNGRIDLTDCRFVDEATFVKWTRRAKPRRNDIVLTREAPLGEVGLLRSDEDVFLGQRTMLYRAKRGKLSQRFLYYAMQSSFVQGQIRGQGSGATVEHLRVPDAEQLLIPLAPFPEQEKIAGVLSAYDDLIANNQRRIALLESMAEEIYREWFVRLRFPGRQSVVVSRGLPAGWREEAISSLVAERKRPIRKAELGSVTRYVGLEHLEPRRITLSMWGDPAEVNSDKLRFEAGDILFGKIRPYLHKVAMAGFEGASSTDAIVLQPKHGRFRYFALFTVSSDTFVDLADAASNGTKMPRADWQFLSKQTIKIPADDLLDQFDRIIHPIIDQILHLLVRCELLVSQRDALLPRLISGKLRVDHLDIRLPPSMQDAA